MAGDFFRDLVLELIYPSFCQLCQKNAEINLPICPDCLEKIERIGEKRCAICGKGFEGEVLERLCGDCLQEKPDFDCARAVAKYQEPMVQIIHRLKYQRGFYFRDWLVDELREVFDREFANEKFDLLIPIPLHWRRILKRGYNQALILAKPLAKKLKIPLSPGALIRTRNTEPQFGLSRTKREENLKKSFQVKDKKLIAGKRILLIDDIITTGITINEAAKALKKAGAEKVGALAVART